jgi:hypothetical protein
MTSDTSAVPLNIEAAAKRHCDWLLRSGADESAVILAFTIGAAWALDEHAMIALARAQFEARQERQQ